MLVLEGNKTYVSAHWLISDRSLPSLLQRKWKVKRFFGSRMCQTRHQSLSVKCWGDIWLSNVCQAYLHIKNMKKHEHFITYHQLFKLKNKWMTPNMLIRVLLTRRDAKSRYWVSSELPHSVSLLIIHFSSTVFGSVLRRHRGSAWSYFRDNTGNPLGPSRDSRHTRRACLIKATDVNKCKHSILFTHSSLAASYEELTGWGLFSLFWNHLQSWSHLEQRGMCLPDRSYFAWQVVILADVSAEAPLLLNWSVFQQRQWIQYFHSSFIVTHGNSPPLTYWKHVSWPGPFREQEMEPSSCHTYCLRRTKKRQEIMMY